MTGAASVTAPVAALVSSGPALSSVLPSTRASRPPGARDGVDPFDAEALPLVGRSVSRSSETDTVRSAGASVASGSLSGDPALQAPIAIAIESVAAGYSRRNAGRRSIAGTVADAAVEKLCVMESRRVVLPSRRRTIGTAPKR